MRSGSLPPADRNDEKILSNSGIGGKRKNSRKISAIDKDDAGARTEPDSATEDTTDYSSSGLYLK